MFKLWCERGIRFLANCFISGFLFLLRLRVQGECTTQLRFMVAHWTCISELMGPTLSLAGESWSALDNDNDVRDIGKHDEEWST